jgi:hypothetical protein
MGVFEGKIKNKNKFQNFWYFGFILFSLFLFSIFGHLKFVKAANTPNIITYQGKLLSGGLAVTTTKDIKFVLYDSASAGTALYSAAGTTSSPVAVSTTLNDGFFTVNLGDSGTNSLDPTVFKNNQSVYLEVIIGSETLSPRKRLTASPFAINAKYLDGIGASSTALSSTYIPISDSSGNFNFNNVTSSKLYVSGTSTLASTTISNLNASDILATNLNITSATFTNATSSGSFWSSILTAITTAFTNLTVTGNSSLATTTISSSTIGFLNVSNSTTIGGILSVTGNSSFGTIASGTWNGNAISSVYGGTGQNTSGWSGFLKLTAGTWSTSTVSLTADVSGILPVTNGGTGTSTMASGGVVFSDGTKLTQDVSKFYWDNTNKFLGVGTSSPQQKLHLYDGTLLVDSPTNPTTTGYLATSTLSGATSVDISGKYAYVTAYSDNRFTVVDITDPTAPVEIGSLKDNARLNGPRTVKVAGKYAYVTSDTGDSLTILNIANPYSMSVVGFVSTSIYLNSAYGLSISGQTAYVTAQIGNQLTAVDISNPSNPTIISSITDIVYLNDPRDVYVQGNYAYVANGTGSGITVVDVSSTHSLSRVGFTSSSVMNGANRIYVSGRYAYVAAGTANALAIVDISNPSSPTTTGSISSFILSSASDVKVAGKYAYVTANGANALAIINISSKSNPSIVGSTFSPVYLIGPNSLFLSGKFVFVASGGSGSLTTIDIRGAEISSASVGDVFTNSLSVWENSDFGNNISIRNGLNVGIGGIMSSGVFSLNVDNSVSTSTLFSIATSSQILAVFGDGSMGLGVTSTVAKLQVAGSGEQLRLNYNNSAYASFSVSNDGSLLISPSNNAITSIANGLTINTSSLVVDRSSGFVGIGTSSPRQKLHLSDGTLLVDNPVNPTLSGSVALNSPRSVYVSGKYAYTLGSSGLQIISIEDVNNPSVVSSLSINGISTGLDKSIFVAGRYAYLTANTSNTLYVIDVSNPKSPSIAGSVTDNSRLTNAIAVYVSGNYAYVAANNTSTVAIVDVANPTSPLVVGSVTDATKLASVSGVYVSGRYAYAVGRDNSYFVVIDVLNPSAPSIVGSMTDATNMGGPRAVYVSGKYAYVASDLSYSIAIIDVSDPATPFRAGSLIDATNLDTAFGIYVSGKYAYVAARGVNRLSIIDISNSSTPRFIGSYQNASELYGPISVFISGKYAYVVNLNSANLAVININGADIHAANIGNITSNDLTVWENSDVGNNLFVRNAINVGTGGIQSNGTITINSNISSGNFFSIVSSTNSSIFMISASGNIGVNTTTFGGGTSYKLKIDAGGASGGAIGADGFIRATAYITPSTTLDLAETYPINLSCTFNGTCPADGDVVCVDPTVVAGVKKCSINDKNNIIGIVSANPGFLLGGGDFLNPTENAGKVKVALAGRVPVKVSTINGAISPGDKLTISNVNGVAAKAVDETSIVGIAMEGFSDSSEGSIVAFVNIGWQNQLYQTLTLNTASSTLIVGSNLTPYNLNLSGELTMFNNVLNKLVFNATALFETNTNDSHAFIFNAKNFGTSTNQYLLSLRSNDEPRFSVLANGDVHTSGNIYAASAVFGTSTNPGDLAERVDIASDDIVEPGDVMVVDMNNPDTYRRSNGPNEQSVAGVISTNPSIVVGNGKTDYTAVMAMVGRVPLKVSSENGVIDRGDLLVTASTSGYAMKYDPKKDQNEKMIGVIGVALEPFSAQKGKILALIRTGWINSRFETIAKLKDNISQLAVAQGIMLSSTSTASLSVTNNNNGQLSYTGGNLNLGGNMLLSVSSVNDKSSRWSIDEFGHFITRFTTSQGEKEMFSIQSPTSEFVFSSSSQLIAGEVKIIFDQAVQDVIDFSAPLKINVTLTSGEAKGIYVSEKNAQGFTVKELDNGKSGATFDWIVVAKRKEDVSNLNLNETISPSDVVSLPVINSTIPASDEVDGAVLNSTTTTASTSVQTAPVLTEQPAVQSPVSTDSSPVENSSAQSSKTVLQTPVSPLVSPTQSVVSPEIAPIVPALVPAPVAEINNSAIVAPVAESTPPASTNQ